MTNHNEVTYGDGFDRLEISYTPGGGERQVLVVNRRTGSIWNLDTSAPLTDLEWKVLRGLSYMLLKTACTRIPLDPDFAAGVAAVAAYQAAQRSGTVINNHAHVSDQRTEPNPLRGASDTIKDQISKTRSSDPVVLGNDRGEWRGDPTVRKPGKPRP